MGIKVELDLQAILAALRQLPEEERQYVAQQLRDVGSAGEADLPDNATQSRRAELELRVQAERNQGITRRLTQEDLDAVEPMTDEEYKEYLDFRESNRYFRHES